MSITSKLIEHVAGRILQKIKENVTLAQTITVKVTKYNPPVNGQIEKVVVIVTDQTFNQ
jgi:dihydroneopterin aldolase